MLLCEYLTEKGNTLFRWRGYTYFFVLPLLYLERGHFHYPFQNHLADTCYEMLCLLVSLCGITIRILTIGFVAPRTSGRNKRAQYAESLNTTGMYSICRNPLYLGNYLVFLGITLLGQDWQLAIINTFLFAALHLPIIMTEEKYLLQKFGDEYREYVSVVPCFVPRPSLWKRSALRWNWWMVLRREHDTVFSLVVVNVIIGCMRESVIREQLSMDAGWTIVGLVSLFLWLAVKVAKKYSRRLDERAAV